MDNEFVWTCPQCGHSVSRRLYSCRCGYTLTAAIAPAPGGSGKVAPASTDGVSPVLFMVVGGIAIAAITATTVLWLRPRAGFAQQDGASAPRVVTQRADDDSAGSASGRPDTLPPGLPMQPASFQPAAVAAPAGIEELVARSMPAVVMIQGRGGTGSGFFVSPDTVLTNAHVVQTDDVVALVLSTGARTAAHVQETIAAFDLAVLKPDVVDPAQATLALGEPSDVQVGSEVIAIGAPLGLQNTVTRGIVSGTRVADGVTLVQTDAAINQGNSGGPLIDHTGQVIGVTTRRLEGGTESIGFAISIEDVRRALGADFMPQARRGPSR